jgi:hypothetical protein
MVRNGTFFFKLIIFPHKVFSTAQASGNEIIEVWNEGQPRDKVVENSVEVKQEQIEFGKAYEKLAKQTKRCESSKTKVKARMTTSLLLKMKVIFTACVF